MSGPGKQMPGPAGGGNRAKLELTAAMRNLTKPTEFGNNEIQFNTGELKKSADLFPVEPINSPTNSNLPAAEKPQPAKISLENIRHERAKDEARR
jgi:hypothetical protein